VRNSDSFRALYDEHRLIQRDRLQAYVKQLGIAFDEHPLVLVDIGWKGSMQDYLRAALPDNIRIQGYYFGLIGVGQPTEGKSGLMFTNIPYPSRYYRTYSENRTLFEVLLCADHGGALRYEVCEDGTIGVLLDNDANELDYIRRELFPLRDDVLAAFREFCHVRNRFCIASEEMERFAARAHAGLVFRPWRANAQSLVQAQHRENFGVFATSRYTADTQLALRDKWRFCLRLARNPRATLNGSFWPAFTLHQHTCGPLAMAYATLRRLQDRRTRQERPDIGWRTAE
jgi:hypothetical protein